MLRISPILLLSCRQSPLHRNLPSAACLLFANMTRRADRNRRKERKFSMKGHQREIRLRTCQNRPLLHTFHREPLRGAQLIWVLPSNRSVNARSRRSIVRASRFLEAARTQKSRHIQREFTTPTGTTTGHSKATHTSQAAALWHRH